MKRNHGPRRIWALLATALAVVLIAVLPGCASALESLGEGLPVSQGEMKEAVESMNETVEGATSGNAWAAGAGGLGVLGIAMVIARRMIKRAIGAYDAAPFRGPNGEEVNEEALVAAALGSKPKARSSKS